MALNRLGSRPDRLAIRLPNFQLLDVERLGFRCVGERQLPKGLHADIRWEAAFELHSQTPWPAIARHPTREGGST